MQECFEKLLNHLKSISFLKVTILGILILIADQIVKVFIEKTMYCGQSLKVCCFLNIVNVHNYGITFGLFKGQIPSVLLAVLASSIVLALAYWIYKERHIMFGGMIIIFGALGNIIDRFVYGYVVDFIDFHICQYHWPAFNIADTFIVFGNISILLIILLDNKHKDCIK